MFITGLFSLLDAMLGIDMDEILEKLPLDETVVQTLTGSGDMQDALKLVDNYEHHRWDEVREQLSGCGIELAECDRLYAEAGVWAQKLLSVAAEASGKQ